MVVQETKKKLEFLGKQDTDYKQPPFIANKLCPGLGSKVVN